MDIGRPPFWGPYGPPQVHTEDYTRKDYTRTFACRVQVIYTAANWTTQTRLGFASSENAQAARTNAHTCSTVLGTHCRCWDRPAGALVLECVFPYTTYTAMCATENTGHDWSH
jgi:hypothetical protein